jgi:hypothetical protein
MVLTGREGAAVWVAGVCLWFLAAGQGCSSDPDPVGPETGCVVCPNPDCHIPQETFASCAYPANPQENTGREAITIGGSVVLGVACYEETGGARCGFIPALEELTGMQIANFGQQYFTAAAAVGGLVPYARVDNSVRLNPDATRVYLLLGGNDVIQYFLAHVDQAPLPEDGCLLKQAVQEQMRNILSDVRLVVERYRTYHGIPEVVVGSQPPVGESSRACNSCRLWAEKYCGNCSQCLNELLGTWSDLVAGMVNDMGGAAAGIFFADHFHGFPEDPGQCALFCDCPHPNCIGHDLMAGIWDAAMR